LGVAGLHVRGPAPIAVVTIGTRQFRIAHVWSGGTVLLVNPCEPARLMVAEGVGLPWRGGGSPTRLPSPPRPGQGAAIARAANVALTGVLEAAAILYLENMLRESSSWNLVICCLRHNFYQKSSQLR